MAINFTQILQDAVNFVRNQQKTFITFSLLLFAALFLSLGLEQSQTGLDVTGDAPVSLQQLSDNFSSLAGVYLLKQLLVIFVSTAALNSVVQISQGESANLSSAFARTAKRFLGVLLLNILITLPISLGMALAYAGGAQSSSFATLILLALGIFVFIRLNLAIVHYVASTESISASLKAIWRAGLKQNGALIIYTLCIYVVLPLISVPFALVGGTLGGILAGFVGAFAQVFGIIFSYRFYSLFIKA